MSKKCVLGLALYVTTVFFFLVKMVDLNATIYDLREEAEMYQKELEFYDTMAIPVESIRVAVSEMISEWTSHEPDSANDLSDVFIEVWADSHVRYQNLMPYVLAIAIKESGCRVEAQHPVTSASGIGQVIYRYHSFLLGYDITKKDLTSDPHKSIMSIYLVLERYWIESGFSYKEAIFSYRGRRYEAYYRDIADIVAMFGCKLFK